MSRAHAIFAIPVALIGLIPAMPAAANTLFFSTGDPDGKITVSTNAACPFLSAGRRCSESRAILSPSLQRSASRMRLIVRCWLLR